MYVVETGEHTFEDEVDCEEVCADWKRDHGKCEAHQLPDDGTT